MPGFASTVLSKVPRGEWGNDRKNSGMVENKSGYGKGKTAGKKSGMVHCKKI
jgi:hypothetical protein